MHLEGGSHDNQQVCLAKIHRDEIMESFGKRLSVCFSKR